MPRSGYIRRQYPRVEVLRGYDPNEPRTLTQSFPVATGVTVLSGQVVSLAWNAGLDTYEWELGWSAGRVPHIALQDSADEDVLEAGKLTGLSSLGKFEIQTAFFKTGDTYNVDVPVSPDGVTGNLKAATLESGDPVMGFISRIRGPKDITGTNSSSVVKDVVVFTTNYSPNTADAT
jgi:hypothetical protein